jgi:hypothetical protein
LETGFGASNTKPGREAIPFGVVTLMLPVAPVPTTAVILVADTTVKEDAEAPPKLTTVVPVKLVPVIVTVAPLPAVDGVNEVIVGTGVVPTCSVDFLQENVTGKSKRIAISFISKWFFNSDCYLPIWFNLNTILITLLFFKSNVILRLIR